MADLTTTNVFLGIMAFVSLLEAMAVIGIFVAGALIVRRLIQVLNAIEERQVAPAVARVNGILDDVREVTSAVKTEAVELDRAIHWAADGVARWRTGARAHRGRGEKSEDSSFTWGPNEIGGDCGRLRRDNSNQGHLRSVGA